MNPYTGETDRVVHVRLGPTIRYQSASGQTVPPDPMIRDYRSELGSPVVHGDRLWLRTDVEARIVLPGPKAPEIILNHYTTIGGRLADAVDISLGQCPCRSGVPERHPLGALDEDGRAAWSSDEPRDRPEAAGD